MTKVYAFFRLSRIYFSCALKDPIFIRFSRKGHRKFSQETIYQIQDSQNVAVFNTEFSVGFSIKPSEKGRNHHKFAYALIGVKKVKKSGKKKFIGKWKFDLANFDSPLNTDERTSQCALKNGESAKLYFNVVIVKQKEFPHGMPHNFFAEGMYGLPTAQTTFQSVPVDQNDIVTETETEFDTPISVVSITRKKESSTFQVLKKLRQRSRNELDETSNSNSNSTSKNSTPKSKSKTKTPPNSGKDLLSSHQNYQNDSKNSKTSKNKKTGAAKFEINAPPPPPAPGTIKTVKSFYTCDGVNQSTPEELAQLQLRKIFLHTIDEQHDTLQFVAFKQCMIKFSMIVYKVISHPKFRNADFSDELIKPIKDYRIFEISKLKSEHFDKLMLPVHKAIQNTIANEHTVSELFSLYSTILNFGIKLAYEGILYTTIYNDTLTAFEDYLNRISILLIQNLVAVFASAIDVSRLEAADGNTILTVQNELFLLWQNMRQMGIPNCVIQQIQVSCCRYIDVLLYNSSVDSKEKLTSKLITTISNKIRLIQEMYQCQSEQVMVAFEQILHFIRTAESLLGGIEISRIGQPSPLYRSIADRCDPPVELPARIKIDRLGPVCKDLSTLRISNEPTTFSFTYEWLIAHEPSLFRE
ncbi:hypothetical protein TRFO_09911 [Tritrichomonas foetus]|uniref:C2 NT-type domain-containing protein n=1 Tax=Tritrichomonas foetus TaxID=1144522 RepID=A0A1J4JGZ2_9EUKA|nr:hypothetical protein TRFO_09911 [Tritrichomonas foetus]|eukprot:OHS96524.1 hypothetical protein TRFO_09911 [Tritrichomonas foetus]